MASPMPVDNMDNTLISCNICFDTYIDPCVPKNLECGHVCCRECLQHLIGSKKKGYVQCPECRLFTKVPNGKIANLPTNFPLKSLAEAEYRRKKCTPTVRRTTLLHRVKTLRTKAERPQQQQQQASQEDDVSDLQLKIQCLERQLQEKEQPSNKQDDVYTDLDSKDVDHPMYMEMDKSCKTDRPLSPSERPLPSIPVSERPRKSLPSGSTLPPGGASLLSSPTDSIKVARNLPSRQSLPEISPTHNASEQFSIHPQRRQLEPVETFGSFEQAQGIALTPEGLVVVCDFMKQTVSVFHKKKGKSVKKFDLTLNSKNCNKPADVAVTKKGKFLVARRTATELYSPKGKYERSLPNFIAETLGVCTVATAENGRILVGDISFFNIVIYDPDGMAILQALHSETKPARIAALQGTLIAVSHARLGRLEIFDSSRNQSIQLIEIPEALGTCHYPNSNFILVVRNERVNPGSVQRNTGVIEQYDIRTGELKVVVAEGLFHPFNLTFTANGMLAVADKWTIKVFRVMENSIYE